MVENDINLKKRLFECDKCSGSYKPRKGKYGDFYGCINYPTCTSTKSLQEIALAFYKYNGINIYSWDKPCDKCHKDTTVYSYALANQFSEYNNNLYLSVFGKVSTESDGMISDIPMLDKYLSTVHKNIYLARTKYHNHCDHCGSTQTKSKLVPLDSDVFIAMYSTNSYLFEYKSYNISLDNEIESIYIKEYIEKAFQMDC